MSESAPNVKIITLGCAKNEVDSEEIAGVLRQAGYALDGGASQSDVTIINTCGFLEASKQESIDAIKRAVRSKGKGRVIVAGCLAQRMGAELARLAPGADAYVGVGQMGRFDAIVKDLFGRDASAEPVMDVEPPHHRWAEVSTRARTGRPWSAYLKVSEGCDHPCTFCTIPSFRGRHRSKPIERVLEEARFLAKTGAVELNLIAQDVTQYGYDLYKKFTLPTLLRELNGVEEVRWIRLLYFYPSRLTDEVIEAMTTLDKVVPYIDIPLQHSHPDVLRRMKRPGDGAQYLEKVRRVRQAMPDAAIRTTFIVGFPGETDAEFQHLMDWVTEARLDRVGAFVFSREPGTPSHDMDGQVPGRIKKERFDRLMRRQQTISREVNRTWVGRSISVLVDEVKDGMLAGRSHRDAPEIDGWVFAPATPEVRPGEIISVTVTEATDYDLYGTIGGGAGVAPGRKLRALRVSQPSTPR